MDRRPTRTPALSRRAALIAAGQGLAVLAAACTSSPQPTSPIASPGATPAATPTADGTAAAAALGEPVALPTEGPGCAARLAPVVAPTTIPYPGYTAVEPSTGLHVTAPPHEIDAATYRLKVTGKVAHELSLTYDELRCLPKIAAYCQIACPGFFIDWSNLAGASLAAVIEQAGPLEGAKQVLFRGIDGRASALGLAEAQSGQHFLAYEWEGEALPRSHGFPVRAALPNQIGGSWVKWLEEIEVM